jgi:hypothetical protein
MLALVDGAAASAAWQVTVRVLSLPGHWRLLLYLCAQRLWKPRLCFFSLFAARFSCRDFVGFFFASRLLSKPLLMARSLITLNIYPRSPTILQTRSGGDFAPLVYAISGALSVGRIPPRRQLLDNVIDTLAYVLSINALPGVFQHCPRPLGRGLSGSNAYFHVNESQWKLGPRPTVVPAEVTGVYPRATRADPIDDFLFDPLHALKGSAHGFDDCHQ